MSMKKIGKMSQYYNRNLFIALGIVAIIIGAAVTVTFIFQPTGRMSGGFMRDGERLSSAMPFSFVAPTGESVDGIWTELKWVVQGEDVVWDTFHIEGKYEIRLWNINSPEPTVLITHPFQHTGEIYVSAPYNQEAMDYDLGGTYGILTNQPYTNPADPTYWTLHLYGEFTASVEDTDGTILSFDWNDFCELTIYWESGTFSGSGSVSTG